MAFFSILSILAPIISLCSPFFVVIVPFFILKYYGITIDNVADFDYSNKDFFQVKNDPSFWQKGFTPPYGGWSRNGINFTRWVAGEAKCMLHDDKAPHVPYKINIPVVNTDLGTIFYPEFKKEFNYKNRHTCLMNVQYKHNVLGLEELTEDRSFLSIPLLDETKINNTLLVSEEEYN